jgi:hypothetical protein
MFYMTAASLATEDRSIHPGTYILPPVFLGRWLLEHWDDGFAETHTASWKHSIHFSWQSS